MDWRAWLYAPERKAAWLDLGGLRALPMHESISIALFDRNTCDVVEAFNAPAVPLAPALFFAQQRVEVVKTAAYAGTWTFLVGDGAPLQLHDLEFEIDCTFVDAAYLDVRMQAAHNWHFAPLEHQHLCWSNVPDEAWIGWRGPAMLWSDLEAAPCAIQWTE